MRYENPEIPEGFNVSSTHPLHDFAWMLAGVAIICLSLVGSAHVLAGWLVPYVPFDFEARMLGDINNSWLLPTGEQKDDQHIQLYLQDLADRLTERTELPEGLALKVHYGESGQKNAFATLGGNIVINRGLLDAVQSENGLAMVIAHEIGHVVHRDPLMATGRATVSLAAMALLSGFSQTRVADSLFSISSESLLLGFSREQERRADRYALELLGSYYGHTGGASEFFDEVHAAGDNGTLDKTLLEFFSTHPDSAERLETIRLSMPTTTVQLAELPDYLLASRIKSAGKDPNSD